MIATMLVDGCETIVGEARYAFERIRPRMARRSTIAGRATRIGKALMKNLEFAALVHLGYDNPVRATRRALTML